MQYIIIKDNPTTATNY